MNKVRKLTTATLKRIIAEEKLKIKKELMEANSKKDKSLNNEDLLSEIRNLIKLKKAQKKRLLEFKKLHEARSALKKKLIKRL